MQIALRHIEENVPAVIKDLYEESFPAEERRAWAKQTALLSSRILKLDQILVNDAFAGFVFYWSLSSFTFIEHFSITPSKRGNGIGTAVIQSLIKKFGRIVLETEIENASEYAKRRIGFYERNGFVKFEDAYEQPPYETGNDFIPMRLMACNVVVEDAVFLSLRKEIYKVVYGL